MSLLENTLKQIGTLDKESMAKTQERLNSLIKPPGSLGVLEDLALQLSGIYGDPMPEPGQKAIVIMGGDHGVVEEGVSIAPSAVTALMMPTFARRVSGVGVLSKHAGASITAVNVGVAAPLDDPGVLNRNVKPGTDNFSKGPAMSREEAIKAIEVGIEVGLEEIQKGAKVLATGDMGIGNTTPSSAILAVLGGFDVPDVTGIGTGITADAINNKIKVIEKGLAINKPDKNDPIDVLSKVGGLEIGALAGLILAGAAKRIPVVVDGFISSAGALIASRLAPNSLNFMIGSHCSAEYAHRTMLETIGLRPMLDMKMRLGEGSGAALTLTIIDAALKVLHEMATFEEIGIVL